MASSWPTRDNQLVESMRGNLLIATPSLFDFFRRSVILMVEHTTEGAFGLVLNRASETSVGEGVPRLAEIAGADEPIWVGGPVGPGSVVVLAEFEVPEDSPKLVVGNVGVADPADEAPIARARIYAGHSGWGPGQLEDELERDSWIVEPAISDDPFRSDDLWSAVLQRRGGDFALLATMPDDPSLN